MESCGPQLCFTRRNCGFAWLNKLEVIYDEIEGLGAPQFYHYNFRVLLIVIMTF